MNINTEKLNLIEWINQINDLSVIDKIKSLKNELSQDKQMEIPEHHKVSIAKGKKEIKSGNFLTLEEFRKNYENRL